MCFLKEPFESVLQKTLSLESSTQRTLTSLDASLSKAISNSNCTLIKFLTRLQNPHGVYENRLKKYNKKNDFYTHGEEVDSWRYEDCLKRHEIKKNLGVARGKEERRREERRREEKDKRVKNWMREMKGTSWNRRARYYRTRNNQKKKLPV
jgi:hypothetical protein